MAGRLYIVENEESMSIVRAVSTGKALNHVVKGSFQVRIATADDVAEYMSQGGTIEDSTITVGNTEIPDPALNGDGAEGEEQE